MLTLLFSLSVSVHLWPSKCGRVVLIVCLFDLLKFVFRWKSIIPSLICTQIGVQFLSSRNDYFSFGFIVDELFAHLINRSVCRLLKVWHSKSGRQILNAYYICTSLGFDGKSTVFKFNNIYFCFTYLIYREGAIHKKSMLKIAIVFPLKVVGDQFKRNKCK